MKVQHLLLSAYILQAQAALNLVVNYPFPFITAQEAQITYQDPKGTNICTGLEKTAFVNDDGDSDSNILFLTCNNKYPSFYVKQTTPGEDDIYLLTDDKVTKYPCTLTSEDENGNIVFNCHAASTTTTKSTTITKKSTTTTKKSTTTTKKSTTTTKKSTTTTKKSTTTTKKSTTTTKKSTTTTKKSTTTTKKSTATTKKSTATTKKSTTTTKKSTTTTKKLSTAATATASCIAGLKEKKNGTGKTGYCCSSSDDCVETCRQGICGL